jgi:hypothetical protein
MIRRGYSGFDSALYRNVNAKGHFSQENDPSHELQTATLESKPLYSIPYECFIPREEAANYCKRNRGNPGSEPKRITAPKNAGSDGLAPSPPRHDYCFGN